MDPSKRCLVTGCNPAGRVLFRVPRTGSRLFIRWRKVVQIAGTGNERICSQHFSNVDFTENVRSRLKTSALPSLKLPESKLKVTKKKGCCVLGCRSKYIPDMMKFPSSKTSAFNKWRELFGLAEIDPKVFVSWKICRNHFKDKDFITVTSRYLKMNAVPSKHLVRQVKVPSINRTTAQLNAIPQCLLDHTYYMKDLRPKSNKNCAVYGCVARSSMGLFLHRFPKNRNMVNTWLHAIKTSTKPTKNSFVCSQHFHSSDYRTGTNILQKTAVPSRHIPLTSLQKVQTRTDNPYKRNFESFRRTRDIIYYSDNSLTSNETAERSLLDQTIQLTGSSNAGPSGLHSVNSCHDLATASVSSDELQSNEKAKHSSLDQTIQLTGSPKAGPSGLHAENSSHDLAPVSLSSDELHKLNQNLCPNCLNVESVPRTNEETVNTLEKTIQSHGKAVLSDFLLTEKDLTTWTGISSLKLLEVICALARTMEDNEYPKKYKMHTTDRVILTFVKLKQNLSFAALSTIFCLSPTTAAEYFGYTVQVLSEVLGTVVYWPSRDEIKRNIPHCFKGKFESVHCVLDCTEVSIASPYCLNCRIACYSNYKHKRTIKFLLGVTPAGLISFCSRAYTGKSSDKYIFTKDNFIDKLAKHQDEIMVDKGFAIEKECNENGIRLHIPPFLREQKLSAQDALLNETIAKARVHVERVIARIKLFGVLQGDIDASVLKDTSTIS